MITVIIPVYKAERCLNRCIDSILAQTCQDWELLLIDDGSPDRSAQICDDYASRDPRIKTVHKTNGGASSARNCGLKYAKGDWVTFIDADDFISSNYFSAINEATTDLVIVESKKIDQNGNISLFTQLPPAISNNEDSYKSILQPHIRRAIMKVPWGKFIKRSCIGNLQFNEGQKIGEDALFMYSLYSQCSSIEIKNGYYYIWQIDTVPDEIKYRLSVDKAIEFVGLIYNSYLKIGIKSHDLEKFLIQYFFMLCDKAKYKDIHRWFEDSLIQEIQTKAYSNENIPLDYRMWHHTPWAMYQYYKMRPVIVRWLKKILNGKR